MAMSATSLPPVGGYQSPIPIQNSNQILIILISILAILVPTLFVGLRILAKRRTAKRINWSDYCLIIALLLDYGLQIDVFIMVLQGGMGFHVGEIIERFGRACVVLFFKGTVAFCILWNLTTLFSKLSVLLLYTNLIPVREMIVPARCMMGFVVLSHTGYIFTQFLICRPFAKSWDQNVDGTCASQPAYYFSTGLINIVVDLTILAMPMPFIARLNLAMRKKLIIVGMFSIGLMTVSISVYRQILLPSMDFADVPYSGVMATVLSGLEPAVAIALACIPCLGPLFGVLPKALPSPVPSRRSGVGARSPWSKRSLATTQHTELESHPFDRLGEEESASEVHLQPTEAGPNVSFASRIKRGSSRFSLWGGDRDDRHDDDKSFREGTMMEAGLEIGTAQ